MKSATVPLAIAAGGVIIAIAVFLSMGGSFFQKSSATGNPVAVRPVSSQDHILGNPAARVVIVEYSDFQCSFCKSFNDTLHEVIANEGANGKVAWVFRNFPLVEIHPDSLKDAEAAECVAQAGGNDAYWKFADALFANQPADSSQFGSLALSAGAPGNLFSDCFTHASSTVDARIDADRRNALDSGAQGTPYSLILVAGKAPAVINGAYSYDAVKQLLDKAISGS